MNTLYTDFCSSKRNIRGNIGWKWWDPRLDSNQFMHLYLETFLSKGTYSNSHFHKLVPCKVPTSRSGAVWGFSVLPKDTSTNRPRELNQQPSNIKTPALSTIHCHHASCPWANIHHAIHDYHNIIYNEEICHIGSEQIIAEFIMFVYSQHVWNIFTMSTRA